MEQINERGKYFEQNQVYIAVAQKAIDLLSQPDIKEARFWEQMKQFIRENRFEGKIGKKKLKNSLQNYIPGLCNLHELPKQNLEIVWKGSLKRPTYRMPDNVFSLYRQGFIDNGTWCDVITYIHPDYFRDEGLIERIRVTGGKAQDILDLKNKVPHLSDFDQPTDHMGIEIIPNHDEGELFCIPDLQYRSVKTRPEQQHFAQSVFAHYGNCCVVCDVSLPAMLQAAHIIPKKDMGNDESGNGLVLCANHHCAFDAGLFVIHPDSLEIIMASSNRPLLGISRLDLHHLCNQPDRRTLQWRYERWSKVRGL